MEKLTDPRVGQAFVAQNSVVASPNNLETILGNQILQQGGCFLANIRRKN
ncbi:hypothetical protein [Staphylococcus equorum]